MLKFSFTRWNEVDDSTVTDSDEINGDKDSTENPSKKLEELVKVTLDADRFATVYLSTLLLPIVIGYSCYSLIYERHLSWYSWGIGALTSCVYTFGFILMCPQLYINHKLKSVSHLPWKVTVS